MYSFTRLFRAFRWLFSGDPSQKRRVHQEMARIASGLFGDYYLGEDCKLWRTDQEFMHNYQRLCPENPYSQERKFMLRELVRASSALPGAMAECGCYEGASAWFIANECPDRSLHLFDSFEGLSEPGSEDNTGSNDVREWRKGDLCTREEKARANLSAYNHVTIHRGWIPDCFDEVADEWFAFVHIDVDLYQPTFDSLAFFYPRMNKGGVILLDDYGFTTCPGAFRAVSEFMSDKPEPVIHCPTGQGIIFKH